MQVNIAVPEQVIIGIVIFIASLLQGVFGFAFILIALPLLSIFLSVKFAVPLLSLFLALLSGILAFRFRGKFDVRGVMPLVIGALIGMPFGILFLVKFDEGFIKASLGVMLIAYSVCSLFKTGFHLPGWAGWVAGFSAGALGGAFNITGPPVVLYLSARRSAKLNSAGSLNFFFCMTSTALIAFHIALGNITWKMVLTFIEMIPVMVAGMFTGVRIFRGIDEEDYKKGLFVLLGVMGIMLFL